MNVGRKAALTAVLIRNIAQKSITRDGRNEKDVKQVKEHLFFTENPYNERWPYSKGDMYPLNLEIGSTASLFSG